MQEQAALARRADGAVTPDRGGGQTGGEDLLCDLAHRDLVVVDRLAAHVGDDPARGITGGMSSGVAYFDVARRKTPAGICAHGRAEAPRNEQGGATSEADLEKRPSSEFRVQSRRTSTSSFSSPAARRIGRGQRVRGAGR